ncbi:hypothetical protein V2J09_008656 [Rumex salicifolius]
MQNDDETNHDIYQAELISMKLKSSTKQNRAKPTTSTKNNSSASPFVYQTKIQHTPLLRLILHALSPYKILILIPPRQVHGEFWLPVEAEDSPMPLEIPRSNGLGVFIEAKGGPDVVGQLRQEALVEPNGVGDVGVLVPVSGPTDLSHNDVHVPEPDGFEGGVEGVEVGVEDAGVRDAVVDDRVGDAVEEGIVDGEVVVPVEAEEWVDVDHEGGIVLGQEADDGGHEVGDVWAERPG